MATGTRNIGRQDRVPEGWQVVRLGDVCDLITDGDWIESKDQGGKDYRLLQLSNIGVGEFIETGNLRWITHKTFKNLNCTEVMLGDVLVARMPDPIGRALYVSGLPSRAIAAVDIAIIRTRLDSLFSQYLSYFLNSAGCLGLMSGLGIGTTRKRIRRSDIEMLRFPLPPLAEQQAIAAVLDSIDEAIERTEAVIAATERLRDALLHELLTRGVPGWHTEWREVPGIGTVPASWEVVRLGDVAGAITSGSRAWSQYFRPDGALFVRSQNISGGTIDRSDAIFVQPPADTEAVRTRIHRGDLLVSITGEPGKVTVTDDTLGQSYVSQHVALVRLNDPGLSDFACEFLRGRAGQNQFRGMAYGQTRPGLSLINVSNARVAFPSSSERNTIADVGKSLHKAIEENGTARNRLRSLKASTADALLTGRVRVGASNG